MEFVHLWKSRWGLILLLFLLLNGVFFARSTKLQEYGKEEYLEEYQNYIESIENAADTMSGISIFSNQNSYSVKNIERTKQVFADCDGLVLEVSNDTAFEQMLSWKWKHLFVLLLVLLAVDEILLERRNGLWEVTYAETPHRKKAAVRRIGALFLTTTIIEILFTGTEGVIGLVRFGGFGDMNLPVQSSRLCQHFPYVISKWNFVGIYLLLSVAGTFAVMLVCYASFYFFREKVMGYLILLGVLMIELLCRYLIPMQSTWYILCYVNLITCFMPEDYMTYYANWGFGTFILNRWCLMGLGMALFWIAIMVWIVRMQDGKRPYSGKSRLEKWTEHCGVRFHEWFAGRTVICKECYKTYFLRGGIFFLAAVGLLAWNQAKVDENSFSEGERLYLEFCREHTGGLEEATVEEIEALSAEVTSLDAQYEEARTGLENGSITQEQFGTMLTIMESLSGKRTEAELLQENLNYLEQLRQQGIEGGLVVQQSYEELLGENGQKREYWNVLFSFLAILLLTCRNYAGEREKLLDTLYRSTSSGCKRVYRAKMCVGMGSAMIVFAIVYGMEMFQIGKTFGWSGMNLPVQSVYCLGEVPLSMPIWMYLSAFLLIRCAVFLSVYEIVTYFSIVSKDSWRCCFLAGLVLAILGAINAMRFWWLLILLGILAGIVGKRKWESL